MSLLVWLPLNKNFRSNGLTNVKVTNNGTTIGDFSCTINNSAIKYLNVVGNDISGWNEFSVCCWAKPTATSLMGLFSLCTANNYWHFTFNSTTFDVRDNATGTTGTRKQYSYGTVEANKWIFICCTYNRGTVKIYKNNVLYSTNVTGGSYINLGINTCYVGVGLPTSTSYVFNGLIRDFRIYNHELSTKERTELSRGLLVHYKLDDAYAENTINLGMTSATYSNIPNGLTYINPGAWGGTTGNITFYRSGGWNNAPYKVYHRTACGSGGFYRKTANDIEIVAGKTYTFSCYIKCSLNVSNFSAYSFNINRSSGNYYINYGKSFSLTTEWQRFEKTFTATSSQAGMYGEMSIIYGNTSSTDNIDVYYSAFQIEENDHATAYTMTSRTATIIYDNSGYENNGTITGSLGVKNNSIRHNKSLAFSSDKIISSDINMDGTMPFTIMSWVRLTTSQNYLPVFWLGNGTTSNGICIHGSLANRLEGGKTTTVTKGFDSTIGSLALNTWKHIAITWDGANLKRYYNGVLSQTLAWSTDFANTLKRVYLGYFWGGNLTGDISDFRLYTSALDVDSINDILTLAHIDNMGNMYCYDLVEKSSIGITKTGILNSSNLIEDNLEAILARFKKDKSIIINQIKEK